MSGHHHLRRLLRTAADAAAARTVGHATLERAWRAGSARAPKRVLDAMMESFIARATARGDTLRTFAIGKEPTVTGDIRGFTWAEAFFTGRPYEPGTTAFLQEHLRPGMRFADIGANTGYFSIIAARRVGPSGRVAAAEPDPALRACLVHLAAANRVEARLRVSSVALADHAGQAEFFRSPDTWNTGLGSLAKTGTHRVEDRVTVAVEPYDHWAPRLLDGPADVVKIDVEGAEADVVRGAERTLRETPPAWIIIEANPDGPAVAMLHKAGFHVRRALDAAPHAVPNLLLSRG